MQNKKYEEDLISRGTSIVFLQRDKEWKEKVKASLKSEFKGKDVYNALEIMEKLKAGIEIEKAISIFEKQKNEGLLYESIRKIILHFSERGPLFYGKTEKTATTFKAKLASRLQERKNMEYIK